MHINDNIFSTRHPQLHSWGALTGSLHVKPMEMAGTQF
jgi:hypothetical protein